MRWVLPLLAACACSNPAPPPPAPPPCIIHFSGAIDDTVIGATCTVSAEDGGLSLTAHAADANVESFDLSLELPATTGAFSSDSTTTWSASVTTGDAGCSYSAGGPDTPPGSFAATLGSDAGADTHGDLTLILYVHAPPLTDCGPQDVENVELTF